MFQLDPATVHSDPETVRRGQENGKRRSSVKSVWARNIDVALSELIKMVIKDNHAVFIIYHLSISGQGGEHR